MSSPWLAGVAAFVQVFLKGFQHQNVIGGRYKSAAVVSFLMAVADVALIGLVVRGGWHTVVPVGTGAAIGIVLSMWIYRKIAKDKA